MMSEYESILENPWFIAPLTMLIGIVAVLLLFVYCPRMDEIKRLEDRITELREKIDGMSKQQTAAELEHIADMEQMRGDHAKSVQLIETEAQDAEQRAKDAEARTEQSEDLRRQIAAAADKMAKEAQA